MKLSMDMPHAMSLLIVGMSCALCAGIIAGRLFRQTRLQWKGAVCIEKVVQTMASDADMQPDGIPKQTEVMIVMLGLLGSSIRG